MEKIEPNFEHPDLLINVKLSVPKNSWDEVEILAMKWDVSRTFAHGTLLNLGLVVAQVIEDGDRVVVFKNDQPDKEIVIPPLSGLSKTKFNIGPGFSPPEI